MEDIHPIDRATKCLGTGLEGLGALLGVTKGAVSQWKMAGRKVPVEHCVSIEQKTNGVVTRKELRPDDWHLIWPELVGDEPLAPSENEGGTTPLKRARLRRGETLQEVADAVGSNTGNISRIERGQVPHKDLTEKLVKHFGGEITETQLIAPEHFAEPDPLPPSDYVGPERRTGEEPGQILPRKRSTNGH